MKKQGLMRKYVHLFSWSENLMTVLAVFTCTFFIYRDFGLRMMSGFLALGLIICVNILHSVAERRVPQITPFKVAAAFLCVVICCLFLLPHSNKNVENISFVISMVVCLGMLVLSPPVENKPLRAVKVFAIAGFCMTLYVLFFTVFEDLFWVTIYPVLSDTAQEYLSYYVPRGYGVSVGGCTYTDYIIIFGMSALSGYLLYGDMDKRRKFAGWVCVFLSFAAVLCVGRKGEFLAAIAVLFVVAVLLGTPRQRKRRALLMVCAGVVAMVLFVLFLPIMRKIDVLSRYVSMIDKLLSGKDITSGRMQLYSWAWNLFLDKPILGIGWGRFTDYIPYEWYMAHSGGGIQVVRDVHCIYLQFLCEGGLIGAVLVIAPLAYCYIVTLKQFLRAHVVTATVKENAYCKLLNHTSFCIQTFLFVIGLIDPCFERVNFWCFYGVALIMQSNAMHLEGQYATGCVTRALEPVACWLQSAVDYVLAAKRK